MTPQEIIHAAERLSFKDLVYLVSQLIQLIEAQVTKSTAEKPIIEEAPTINFRELSGLLYRPEQPAVSIDEMSTS